MHDQDSLGSSSTTQQTNLQRSVTTTMPCTIWRHWLMKQVLLRMPEVAPLYRVHHTTCLVSFVKSQLYEKKNMTIGIKDWFENFI